MDKPIEPEKPNKPNEPTKADEYLETEQSSLKIYDGQTIKEILNRLQGLDLDTVTLHIDHDTGYYRDSCSCEVKVCWVAKEKQRNPNFDRDMKRYGKRFIKYEKEMLSYRQEMKIYNSSLKEYNSLNKQYLKWFHENELKKLND